MNIDSFINIHLNNQNKTSLITTGYVTQRLKERKRIIFTKFGDGEYQCMIGYNGTNCDGDMYHSALGNELREAFLSLCDMSQPEQDSIFIGRWHYPQEVIYYSSLYWNHQQLENVKKEIPFVHYHLIYNDNMFNKSIAMFDLVSAIQSYDKTKVVVTNQMNQRLTKLFKANEFITIEPQSWFFKSFDNVLRMLDDILVKDPHTLVLIAGGLASKVLIARLCSKYPYASFLDIGSGFDILATTRDTRGNKHTYLDEVIYYSALLPGDWH